MGQYALMMVGIVIGGIAGAGIWGIIGSMKSRAMRRKSERSEQIITSVEEKWIDAENLVRLYRSGRLNGAAFRESLDEKIESINRLYKPSIHQLDIFFVKYTEKLIDEYLAMITAGASQVSSATMQVPIDETASTTQRDAIPVGAAAAPMEAQFPIAQTPFPVQEEEQIISEMTDAAATDNNFQLESFLEMESSSPVTETLGPADPEEMARAAETKSPAPEAALDPEAVAGIGGVPPFSPEEFAVQQQAMSVADFPESRDAAAFEPPPPPGFESGASDGQESETIIQLPETPFSFSGKVSSEQEFEPVPPPPDLQAKMPSPLPPPVQHHAAHPFALPSRSRAHMVPPAPAFTKEEVAQPATIYDVEAETIIVDRSTIMGAQRPASAPLPENDKKSIGITGEDVSDAFDAFFGPSKK